MNPNQTDTLGLRRGSRVAARPLASTPVPQSAATTRLDRLLMRALLHMAGDPPYETRLWDGTVFRPLVTLPDLVLHVRTRRALYLLLADAELCFGDLYSSGDIDISGDLVTFFETAYIAQRGHGRSALARLYALFMRGRRRLNTIGNAREHIRHHYDLGNEFYRLWLDQAAMQYTCAYYPEADYTLEQAQIAKMRHVCRKLRLVRGMRVAEAGCGWGGLSRFMAREFGVSVRAYNISHEQVAFARQQALKEGVADRVEYVEDDYRMLDGRFDAFVSVGMLEHVGPEHYRDLGRVIDRCLTPTGIGLIHSIGRNSPAPMNAWIERRIFPGAHPPSLFEMAPIFEPSGLSILDVENLRMHYARTLQDWLARFDGQAETVRTMYDDAFVRAWRMYLAGSVAAFTTGSLQLFQVVFARAENNDLPWSRRHLYAE